MSIFFRSVAVKHPVIVRQILNINGERIKIKGSAFFFIQVMAVAIMRMEMEM